MARTRHEKKYTLTKLEYKVLVSRLEKFLDRDQNSLNGGYIVTSLYYDDIYNNAYKQKVDGVAVRHKYRIRYYNDDLSLIKLERKSKINQMTVKTFVTLTKEEVIMLYRGEIAFLLLKDESLYKDFYCQIKHNMLQPKTIVKYEREAFSHPVGDIRITFDRNVRSSTMGPNIFKSDKLFVPVVDSNDVIMEIKFNRMIPDYIKSIIQTGHVTQASKSKYILARKYKMNYS